MSWQLMLHGIHFWISTKNLLISLIISAIIDFNCLKVDLVIDLLGEYHFSISQTPWLLRRYSFGREFEVSSNRFRPFVCACRVTPNRRTSLLLLCPSVGGLRRPLIDLHGRNSSLLRRCAAQRSRAAVARFQ